MGVVMSVIVGMSVLIALAVWYCCGGRARWNRRHQQPNATSLPLYTVDNTAPEVRALGDALPIYAEVPPPEHQTVAGGTRDANEQRRVEEEEAAVVSDGKTPLSEIPFEDVVLGMHGSDNQSSSGESSQFEVVSRDDWAPCLQTVANASISSP